MKKQRKWYLKLLELIFSVNVEKLQLSNIERKTENNQISTYNCFNADLLF